MQRTPNRRKGKTNRQPRSQSTPAATRIIHADGLAVAPGFIDLHTHCDAQICTQLPPLLRTNAPGFNVIEPVPAGSLSEFSVISNAPPVEQAVREPKEEIYGTVAVFRDLYANLWDLIQPKRQPTSR